MNWYKVAQDMFPGGLADGKTLRDIAIHHCGVRSTSRVIDAMEAEMKLALEDGIKVEMEHTSDAGVAREIAMDHLWEDPEYYDKLKEVEGEGGN